MFRLELAAALHQLCSEAASLLICMLILFPLKQSASRCAGRIVLLSMVEEIMTPLIFVHHDAFSKKEKKK